MKYCSSFFNLCKERSSTEYCPISVIFLQPEAALLAAIVCMLEADQLKSNYHSRRIQSSIQLILLEMRSDLQPLISEPREDLAVEYKNWLDFAQEEHKATLAKSCIALANHGGGFLVIGFEEQADSLISIACPANIAEISQDTVNSVIRRYADPEFHCQLLTIAHPTTHVSHPIVTLYQATYPSPLSPGGTCPGTHPATSLLYQKTRSAQRSAADG